MVRKQLTELEALCTVSLGSLNTSFFCKIVPFLVGLLYFGEKAVGGGSFLRRPRYGYSEVVTAILLLFANRLTACGERRNVPCRGSANWTSSTVTALYCSSRVTRVKSTFGQNAESLNVNACGKLSNHRAFKGLPRLLA
jgi:hypothetical protein